MQKPNLHKIILTAYKNISNKNNNQKNEFNLNKKYLKPND